MVYFNALTGLLFTFPSRYLFTIDLQKYLALAVSSAGFPQGIRVLRYSRRVTKKTYNFHLRGCHPLWLGFPADSINYIFFNFPSINPPMADEHHSLTTPIHNLATMRRFGLLPFRSPLLGEYLPALRRDYYFLFLRVLKCFTSPGAQSTSSADFPAKSWKGFPIRKSPDQRSLGTSPKRIAAKSRPSSPFGIKESTVCS